MSSYQYVDDRFLELEQVAALSGLPENRLLDMIAAGCLPGPAYTVWKDMRISSFFGIFEEKVSTAYYTASTVEKSKDIDARHLPLSEVAVKLRQEFEADYKRALVELAARDYGLSHLFDENGAVAGQAAEELFSSEWQHYLDGTYSVCTKTAAAYDIATKEIMAAKIKFLCKQLDTQSCETLLRELERAVDKLDDVSSPFAPHEVLRSSRETYINQVRRKYLSNNKA